ncbi:PepSY domain-containing protein [Rhizobium sp. EC-SD404]|uniref:PepSY domain-containing protein n=1 Tax=Rhizobium sp. EC-SD404 TaxID=2038389 RepID=UPI0018FE7BC5|nr:PepSY domain-containing protein [Rhizobium sp. EC-SD404]
MTDHIPTPPNWLGRPFLSGLFVAAGIAIAGTSSVAANPLAPTILAQSQDATVSIAQAMERAQARFEGTVIEAVLDTGRPHEQTDIVYALRMLTPRGDILRIRVDGRDGAILEADGRGLVDARRRP